MQSLLPQVFQDAERRHYLVVGAKAYHDAHTHVSVGKPARGLAPVKDYPPLRLIELLLGLQKLGRSMSASIRAELATYAKDKRLAYDRTNLHNFTGELKMATAKKTAAKKAAPAKKAAAKAAPAKKAAAPEAAAPSKRGRVAALPDDAKIKVLVSENPKKRESARVRFELYKSCKTVADAKAAGMSQADINWDVKQGFISAS